MKAYRLNRKQYATIVESETERLFAYVGGIRSGKTITGAHWALHNILNFPKAKGGIFSNTVSQLNTATLSEFIQVLESYGLFKGEHYVANKDPERYFGYKSKFEKHNGVWSFMNGAQIITFSIETMIRGIELGWCWGDEVQDAAIDSLNIVLGRMSGAKFPRTLWTMTPPMDNADIDEMIWGEKAIPHTIGTTYDNKGNLPEGYIEQLESTYDNLTFKREVLAQRVTMNGLNWLYSFEREKHISGKAAYDTMQPVYVSIDFNNNPFTAILAHRGRNAEGKQYIHYFDEITLTPDQVLGRTFIEAMVEEIFRRTPAQVQNRLYFITGDASGRSQSVIAKVGQNMWSEIVDRMRVSPNNILVPRSNPPHQESRRLCNSIFSNYDEVLINPKCKVLIRDCEFVKALPDGGVDKGSRAKVDKRADALDCLRYDLHANNRQFIFR